MTGRPLAEEIAFLLAQLHYQTGLGGDPDLIVRIVDARTGEALTTSLLDVDSGQVLRQTLKAKVEDRVVVAQARRHLAAVKTVDLSDPHATTPLIARLEHSVEDLLGEGQS